MSSFSGLKCRVTNKQYSVVNIGVSFIVWAGSSPGHESANLGPSTLRNEESDNGVCHCPPGFTNEQHHGGLEGVDLQSGTGTGWSLKKHARRKVSHLLTHRSHTHYLTHSHCLRTRYLSDIQQVDLQEEGRGAGCHLLGRAANGETQFTA